MGSMAEEGWSGLSSKIRLARKETCPIAALAVVSEALGETVSANELAAYVLGVMGTGALSVARPTEMQGKALSRANHITTRLIP